MRVLFIALCIMSCFTINAQIINPKELGKRKAQDRTNGAIDRTLDKGFDKVEEGIGNIFKKKEKPEKEEKTNTKTSSKREVEADTDSEQETASKPSGSKSAPKTSTEQAKTSMKTYSKFDFVAGEKVLAFDDFATTNIGDFPLGWNTNSTAELVNLEGRPEKWLFMSKDGFFMPEYVKDMPENFTLEFDVFTRYNSNNLLNYSMYISAVDNTKKDLSNKYIENGIYFDWRPCKGEAGYIIYEKSGEMSKNDDLNIKQFASEECSTPLFAKVSIWRQKTRLRMYINESKILDLPQAFDAKLKYNVFKFGTFYMNYATADNPDEFMVANLRYAVGAPDTRNKLITEGKLVTRGILFDVNSDKIKPESYGVLKEIGTVLKENAAVKIKIIGHTDADGDDAKNLDLSKRRAVSVKNALSAEFGIEAARIETDGKGETQPSDPNTTPQGKANNRRVEFLKL